MKLYAVVMRKTRSEADDVEIFKLKSSAKAFIKAELQRYIDAYRADVKKSGIGDPTLKRANDIQCFRNANGEAYSVYYGRLDGGDYVYSAELKVREIR